MDRYKIALGKKLPFLKKKGEKLLNMVKDGPVMLRDLVKIHLMNLKVTNKKSK